MDAQNKRTVSVPQACAKHTLSVQYASVIRPWKRTFNQNKRPGRVLDAC